ncbi:aminotransferase class IV [Persicobacter sp. CCB-QB2]|uniref:aminotransferase class IV n=1 Tax=Persicobacter sp. CCB-QB2 TaxID=1561025 RepID=UPI0006A979F3|nr:aminotransferase class IV [Persicobacter sp. CCB-QB2]
MKVLFNHQILEAHQVKIPWYDRGFQYADGIFETIIVKGGIIQFWDYHLERLKNGLQCLKLENSPQSTPIDWKEKTLELLKNNRLEDARIKIMVWRKSGGLYTPQSKDFDFLISSQQYNDLSNSSINQCGISQEVRLGRSSFSHCKTINALPYVIAGMERKEKQWQEIILLDHFGHISECGSANIFWMKNQTVYTPSLESGCIAGVRRAALVDQLRKADIPVVEGLFAPKSLFGADAVWKTNVTGIVAITQIENHLFQQNLLTVIKNLY